MKRTVRLLLLSLCGVGAAVDPAPATVAPPAPAAAPFVPRLRFRDTRASNEAFLEVLHGT